MNRKVKHLSFVMLLAGLALALVLALPPINTWASGPPDFLTKPNGLTFAGPVAPLQASTTIPLETLERSEPVEPASLKGVPPNWLVRVQADILKSEYHVTWQEQTHFSDLPAAYHAPNRANNLRTYLTPSGLRVIRRIETESSWEWGLRLNGYGYAGTIQPVTEAELFATDNRIEYRRPDMPGGLIEWYLNDERGLEQGFTIQSPPSARASGPLLLNLVFSGNLAPTLTDNRTAIDFSTPNGEVALRYNNLHAYDATDRELPAWLELDSSRIKLVVDDTAAVYPITIDPLLTSPSWTAEGNQNTALFGYAVGTAGDVNGDTYDDVIVGAYGYDNGQNEEGRAFVYHGSGAGLSTTANWTAESDLFGAKFGIAVGTAGDVNNDGYDDVIVGASDYANGQTLEGRAYVYHGSATGLMTTTAWTVESNVGLANFGISVGTAGDVNGDLYDDVIVGASGYYDDLSELLEGGAFVYHGSATGLLATAAFTAESNQAQANFGIAVGTAGDVNNDGYADVIVGAPGYDNGQTDEGRAYVYYGSATGLITTTAWMTESNQASANFGASVGTAGNVNGDLYDDVIVGADFYDNGQTNEGRAFVYHGSATGLLTTAAWTAESDQDLASFGSSVGTAGDVNNDGFADVIVGAPGYDINDDPLTLDGRAYLYHGSATGLSLTAGWTVVSDQVGANFGISVGTAGNVNGDDFDDAIVGAYFYDNDETDEGRAFVYHGTDVDQAIAGLSATNDSPTELGQATTLMATVTAGGGVNYTWAFGDGGSDSGAVVTHTYSAVGVYPVVVTATNSINELTATTTVTITSGTPTVTPTGSITGIVTAAETGLPLADVLVLAYQFDNIWLQFGFTTTITSGHYTINNLAPGDYRVFFLDQSGSYMPEHYDGVSDFTSATTVTVSADTTTPDINATLEPIAPPLAQVSGNVIAWSDPQTGEVNIWAWDGSNMTISHTITCTTGTPTNVELVVGTQPPFPMTESPVGSGQYSVDLTVPGDLSSKGQHDLDVQWQCDGNPQSEHLGQITVWLFDPSGQVTDANSGDPIEGAIVTLYRVPGALPDTAIETRDCRTVDTRPGSDWSSEPPAKIDSGVFVNPELFSINGTQEISPTLNPQMTGTEGRYAWDVVEGCWYVVVQATGYETTISPIVGVPPAVTDLNLALSPKSKQSEVYLPVILK